MWRIYTEAPRHENYYEDRELPTEREKLENLLNEYFDGYTIYKTRGYWKGESKDSIVIEIEELTGKNVDTGEKISTVARKIRKLLNQEAVLIQHIESSPILIEGRKKK